VEARLQEVQLVLHRERQDEAMQGLLLDRLRQLERLLLDPLPGLRLEVLRVQQDQIRLEVVLPRIDLLELTDQALPLARRPDRLLDLAPADLVVPEAREAVHPEVADTARADHLAEAVATVLVDRAHAQAACAAQDRAHAQVECEAVDLVEARADLLEAAEEVASHR